jgi:RHS repeat-associated protein
MTLPYGQIVAEYGINRSLKCSYVYGLERISQSRNDSVHYYIADGQGSIRALTDVNGNITDTYYYTAFGEELAKTGTTENEFRYTGEQWDPNAGFYYLRARWMDPSTGRFVSVDPYAGDPQAPVSLHRYLYGNNSPINCKDPTGKVTMAEHNAAMTINNILTTSFRIFSTAFNIIDKVNTALDIISAVRAVVELFGAGAPAMVDVGKITKEIAANQAADFWEEAEQELRAQSGTIVQNVTLHKTKLMVKDAPKMKRPDFKFILYLPSLPKSSGPWMAFSSGIKINNKKVELYAGNLGGRLAGVGYSVNGNNNQLFRMDYHSQHGNSNTTTEWPGGIFHFHVDTPY